MSDYTIPGKDWTVAQRVAYLAGAFAYEGHRDVVLQLAKEVGALEARAGVGQTVVAVGGVGAAGESGGVFVNGMRVETLPTGAVTSEGARGSMSFDEAVNTRPTGAVTTTETPGSFRIHSALPLGTLAEPEATYASYRPSPAKPEHPAPWTWNRRHDVGSRYPEADEWITDANGAVVAGGISVDSPLARELIRLAPEMEEALRYFVEMLGNIRPAHPKMVAAMNILSSLDAARAVKP